MTQKKNFWTQVISTMNGMISFGALSPQEDVTSSIELKALDGRHFLSLDEDGPRTGWTVMNAPGATMIHTGEDLAAVEEGSDPPEGICEKEAFVVIAENGDIQLKAANGKVRIEGHDVEIVANGTVINQEVSYGKFWVQANETIKLDSKNITLDGNQSLKLLSTGLLTISGGLSTQILSPLICGVTAATVTKALPKPGQVLAGTAAAIRSAESTILGN